MAFNSGLGSVPWESGMSRVISLFSQISSSVLSTASGPLLSPPGPDVILDPVITGLGTDRIALYGDEAVEQEGEGSQTWGLAARK